MVRRVENIADAMEGHVTYDLEDGRYVRFDLREVREVGLERLLAGVGINLSTQPRAAVFCRGKQIGTVPATFEPSAIRSTSMWYDPRPGDFVWSAGHWETSPSLGPGDLDAVPGFQRLALAESQRK